MTIAGTTGTDKVAGKQAVRVGIIEAPFANATAVAGAATANGGAGIITSESLTTVAAATYTLTVTNNAVTVGDIVMGEVFNGTNTTGVPSLATVTPGAGIFTAVVQNISAATAFGGTLQIAFQVIKKAGAPL